MKDLKQQFQEETNLSFNDIPINGVHLEYINWLEKRIKALSIANVVGRSEQLKCPNCKLEYDKEEIEMFRGLCESCRDRAF